jgi:hypothetical protein
MQLVDQDDFRDDLTALRRELDLYAKQGLPNAKVGNTRYMSLAKTYLEFGRGWLGKAYGGLTVTSQDRGYPESYKFENCLVEPSRDVATVEGLNYFQEVFDVTPGHVYPVQRVKYLRHQASRFYYRISLLRDRTTPNVKLPDTKNDGGLNLYETLSQALYAFHNLSMSLGFEVADMLNDERDGAVSTVSMLEKPESSNPDTTTSGLESTPPSTPVTPNPSENGAPKSDEQGNDLPLGSGGPGEPQSPSPTEPSSSPTILSPEQLAESWPSGQSESPESSPNPSPAQPDQNPGETSSSPATSDAPSTSTPAPTPATDQTNLVDSNGTVVGEVTGDPSLQGSDYPLTMGEPLPLVMDSSALAATEPGTESLQASDATTTSELSSLNPDSSSVAESSTAPSEESSASSTSSQEDSSSQNSPSTTSTDGPEKIKATSKSKKASSKGPAPEAN